MKNRNFILVIVSILSVCIILTGCYSYRPITKEQLMSKTSASNLKFVLNDESEILVNDEDSVNTSAPGVVLITKYDSTEQRIPYKSISKIYEESFDGLKTFFAGFWTLFGLIVLLGLLIGNSLRMG